MHSLLRPLQEFKGDSASIGRFIKVDHHPPVICSKRIFGYAGFSQSSLPALRIRAHTE